MPTRIGRFAVLSLLGQGGMGHVYACYDEKLDRKLAVKVLRIELFSDRKNAAQRLMREAQAMARLSHPNIVTVYEAGESEGQVFVAMEFVPGKSLDEWVNEPRPWQEVLSVFLQAGRGLAAAHRVGIVHRDFKPQNAMITEDGVVKVLDFGLARVADGNMSEAFATAPDAGERPGSPVPMTLTRTGTIIGTPAYMSPEQHRGEVAAASSDQFSFCVSLYQGLYGLIPYPTESLEALRHAVLQGIVTPAPIRSKVPPRIFAALRRGMMSDPAQRFGSMTELLAALERDPMRRFWQGATLLGALVASGGASAAIMGTNQVEVCPDAGAELAEIWNFEQTARVAATLQVSMPSQADAVMALVGPQLDAYATAWTTMRNDACLAHAEGRQSVQLFDLRTSCLDQRRASLSATVEVVRGADGTTLSDALKAVRALPRLEACADVEALTAELPPPADPELRIRVQHHRETLARAEVLEVTSQTRQALSLTERVLADAETGTYEPLLAEAYLRKGTSLIQERAGSALGPLDEALRIALRVGHARVAALASTRRVWVLAELLGQANEAQRDLFWVNALNQKVQGDTDIYKEYLLCAATVQYKIYDLEAAGDLLQDAMTLVEKEGSQETLLGLTVLRNTASLKAFTRRWEEALPMHDRALALSDKLFGDHYSDRSMAEICRVQDLWQLGRPRAASLILEKLIGAPSHEWQRAEALFNAVIVESLLGNFDSARRHILDLLGADNIPPVLLEYWPLLMYFAAKDGDVGAMEKVHEEMAKVLGPKVPADGMILAALGRHREAVALFEKKRTELTTKDRLNERLDLALLALNLGQSYQRLGEYERAEKELMDSLKAYQALVSPRNLELGSVMLALGELALEQRKYEQAAEWLQRAESVYTATAEPDYWPLTRTRAALTQAQVGVRNATTPNAPAPASG